MGGEICVPERQGVLFCFLSPLGAWSLLGFVELQPMGLGVLH